MRAGGAANGAQGVDKAGVEGTANAVHLGMEQAGAFAGAGHGGEAGGELVFGGLKKRKGVRDFFTLFFGMIFLWILEKVV